MELAELVDGRWLSNDTHTVFLEFEHNTLPQAQWRTISALEAYEMMGQLDEFVILDVRTQGEFDEGHIAGARLIPHDELARRVDEIDENLPVLIYCRSGRRSAIAAQILTDAGFWRVYDFGGIYDWHERFE